MSILLKLAFLFFIGSGLGWVLELFFRHFNDKDKRWINPGFCKGPYLPIYGFGLCILYLLASLESYLMISNVFLRKGLLFILMAVSMTLIEYIGGYVFLKYSNVRLWDYSDMWGNVNGLICPLFSLIWSVMGMIYYFFIHPYSLRALDWLASNLTFCFFIGFFFGVFMIDAYQSTNMHIRIRQYAKEKELVLHYERLKERVRTVQSEHKFNYHFFSPFKTERQFKVVLNEIFENLKDRKD
ncbi:MAG: putative ABC transporter permease [Erysipelotrichaceae bacterium]|nr:putative ABC transporter permease [Erysipelotrichaceae bacterium]